MKNSLLDELANLDVVLTVADGRLIVDAPDDVLTPQLLESIRQNKPALLSLLTPAVDPTPAVELGDDYESQERAAIMEFDGGLPRAEAERRAAAQVHIADRFRGWELLPDADGNLGLEPPAGTVDCVRWWATCSFDDLPTGELPPERTT